jgi:hypothetical protein
MKAKLFAALALVVMTAVFNPVGAPRAIAQGAVQVGGQAAVEAIKAALSAGKITPKAAQTLIDAVTNQGATVAVQNSQLVVGAGANVGAAAGVTTALTAANVAVAMVIAGVVVAVSSEGTPTTTGTTGTTGTK